MDVRSGLSAEEEKILALERQWWKYAGAKDQAIRDQLGMTSVAYYQTLNRLIDTEEALTHDPMPVSYTHLTLPTNREV